MAPFALIALIFCIPEVTEQLPEPAKGAFTELRKNTLMLASREGYGSIKITSPRGLWSDQSGGGGGVEHVGGR